MLFWKSTSKFHWKEHRKEQEPHMPIKAGLGFHKPPKNVFIIISINQETFVQKCHWIPEELGSKEEID